MRPGLPDPLIDLLGGRWALGAPAAGIAWFGDPQQVGFGLADGTVAIGRAGWEGAAEIRDREGGGVELVPASEAAPPMMRVGVHEGPCLAVAADAHGLLTGGLDGRLALVGADGGVETLASFPGQQIGHTAAAPGVRACAAGREVRRFGQPPGSLHLPEVVTALAFDGTGQRLAIAHAGGLTVWASAEQRLAEGSTVGPLVWTPDGRHVVGNTEAGLTAWRLGDSTAIELGGRAGSLSVSIPGGFVAASGAARVVCWQLGAEPPVRRECGVGSSAAVALVACHPRRPLIAAGYENGAVLLCQPDSTDILFVREAGGGAVTALAWSGDGATLALAVAGGEVGIVTFPERLFRGGRTA